MKTFIHILRNGVFFFITAIFIIFLLCLGFIILNESESTDAPGESLISLEDEAAMGDVAVRNTLELAKSYRHEEWLDGLQDCIVYANPEVLHYQDTSPDGRYLHRIYILEDFTHEVFARSEFDGNIFISKEMINFLNAYHYEGYGSGNLRQNTLHNTYNNSTMAFTIAHEMAHWKNKDLLRRYHTIVAQSAVQKAYLDFPSFMSRLSLAYIMYFLSTSEAQEFSKNYEMIADMDGCAYVDKYGIYSGTGGALMSFHRLWEMEKMGAKDALANPHLPALGRINQVKTYLYDSSMKRVLLDNDDNLFLDGVPLYGTGKVPPLDEVTDRERTYFVAGQIANAIKRGCFKRSANLHAANMGFVYRVEPVYIDGQSGLLVNDSDGRSILLDKFYMDEERLQGLVDGTVVPRTQEDWYAYQL